MWKQLVPLWLALLFVVSPLDAADSPGWVEVQKWPAPEAFQAAAADGKFLYAISSTQVARYDRATGERLAISTGPAKHLNSGLIHEGRLLCAHSNYPQTPEKSEIKALDLETMELTEFKDFGAAPHGSLVWVLFEDGHWWCTFAKYGAENHRTAFVKYTPEWKEVAVYTFPPSVIEQLGKMSVSGGVWLNGTLVVTDHDHPRVYRLKLPQSGTVLEHLDTVPAPFTGQGIAVDIEPGGLVGIHRARRELVIAEPASR